MNPRVSGPRVSGNLPQVSWIIASVVDSDHPPAPALFGENTLSAIITALTANPAAWAKTALFVTYDENGGFFDHVAPVTAPAGTPGEYVTVAAVPDPTVVGNPPINGPIGLGFRVPTLVISPFSRGGFVSSDLFDHTSMLALSRDAIRRRGAQPERVAAPDGWRYDHRIQLQQARHVDPVVAVNGCGPFNRHYAVRCEPGGLRALSAAHDTGDAHAGNWYGAQTERRVLTSCVISDAERTRLPAASSALPTRR